MKKETPNIPRITLRRIIVTSILLALLIAGTIYLARMFDTAASAVRTGTEEAAAARQAYNESLQLLDEFSKTAGNAPKVYEALPSADYIVPFVDELETLAELRGLEAEMTFTDPIETQYTIPALNGDESYTLYNIRMTLQLTGTAAGLQRFMESFEELPYFVTTNTINIATPKESGWEEEMRATVEATLRTAFKQ